jgi:hypothetical protein
MSPEEASGRAEEAKHLLSNPLLKESFDNAEAALNQAIRQAKTPEEAFKAAIACQVFDLIRGQLQAHIETAKVMDFNMRRPSFFDRAFGR